MMNETYPWTESRVKQPVLVTGMSSLHSDGMMVANKVLQEDTYLQHQPMDYLLLTVQTQELCTEVIYTHGSLYIGVI